MSESGMSGIQNETAGAIVHKSTHDPYDETGLSSSVLMALDSVPGYDLESSDTVVYDHIDLDALDELFRPISGALRKGTVSFPVDGYEVTVSAEGEVVVRTA